MRTRPSTRAARGYARPPSRRQREWRFAAALIELVQMRTAPTRARSPMWKEPCQLLSGLADVAASHHELGIGPGRQQIEVP